MLLRRNPLCAFALALSASLVSIHATAQQPVQITVDAAHPAALHVPTWNYFGADEPNYSYAPNGQHLLRELSHLSPTPVYVRLHNLLTTGDGTASLKWGSTNAYTEDEDGNPIYDWTITDRIFDALRDNGVRPLVEVGFMPQALSISSLPYRHTFPKGSVFTAWSYPPNDYAKWSALITAWTRHLRTRYGPATDTWLWEVWNEPDIDYWHGSPQEYDKLYDLTAAAIQKVLPHARIGGPEVTGVSPGKSEAFLRQFLVHCAHGVNAATGQKGAPLAFISFHPKGAPQTVNGHVRMDVAHQLRAMDLGMRVVASYPEWKNTPIILGESDPEGCAACKGPQNGYRNGSLYGVSVAEVNARSAQLAIRNQVHLKGAVTWAFEFEDEPIFAGFRELATSGNVDGSPFLIAKPVLNVFRLLGKLAGRDLPVTSTAALPLESILADSVRSAPDVDAIATRSLRHIDVLLWNYHDDDVPSPASPVHLTLRGVPAGQVRMEQFLVDRDHSNAYTAWLTMGSPAQPTAQQVADLSRAAELERPQDPSYLASRQGTAGVDLALERQAVMLIRFTW